MEEQATEYAASYVNMALGGFVDDEASTICKAILAGPNPIIMATMVVVMIMREDQDCDLAEEFIRRLTKAQTE